jgi:hypothetical protein
MHADNLVVNNGRARQTVKGITKLFPYFDTEAATAFIVESIYAVDPCTLVISSKNKKVFGILDFVREEQGDNFNGLLTAIHIVAKEEIVRLQVHQKDQWISHDISKDKPVLCSLSTETTQLNIPLEENRHTRTISTNHYIVHEYHHKF